MNENEIEVRLSEEEYETLIISYVRGAFSAESQDQFYATLERTGDIKEALYNGVINETINALLARMINEIKDNPAKLAELQALAEQHYKEKHEQSQD